MQQLHAQVALQPRHVRLTATGDTPSWRAAAEKLPAPTVRTKASIPRRLSTIIASGLNLRLRPYCAADVHCLRNPAPGVVSIGTMLFPAFARRRVAPASSARRFHEYPIETIMPGAGPLAAFAGRLSPAPTTEYPFTGDSYAYFNAATSRPARGLLRSQRASSLRVDVPRDPPRAGGGHRRPHRRPEACRVLDRGQPTPVFNDMTRLIVPKRPVGTEKSLVDTRIARER